MLPGILKKLRTVLALSIIFLLCIQTAELYALFEKTEPTVLTRAHLVYAKKDNKSKIVNIFASGITLKLQKQSKGWYRIVEGDYKKYFIRNVNSSLEKLDAKKKYTNIRTPIPKRGRAKFNLRKIAGKYSYSIKNGNTKKVLQRLARLEKIKFTIPSELPPVTMSGSGASYYDVLSEILSKTSIIGHVEGNKFLPPLWPKNIQSKLFRSTLFYNYYQDNDYESTGGEYGDDGVGYEEGYEEEYNERRSGYANKIKEGQSLKINGEDFDYSSEVSKLGLSKHAYTIIRNRSIVILNRSRKKIRETTFDKLLSRNKISTKCQSVDAYTHMNGGKFVLLLSGYSGCRANSSVLFFNEKFKLLSRSNFGEKVISNIDFSEDGSRLFLRLSDAGKESFFEKTDVILDSKGKKIFKKSTPGNKPVLYDYTFENSLTFNHNQIQVYNVLSNRVALKKQTSIKFKKSWLISSGNETVAAAEGSTLQAFDLKEKQMSSYYNLSKGYEFLAISKGSLALAASRKGNGTWSVLNLLDQRVCGSFYRGDVFSQTPSYVRAFPNNDYYIVAESLKRSQYIIIGDCNGNLYRVKLFNNSQKILSLEFKGGSFLEIKVDRGIFYIPIYKILQNKKKINV